MAIDACPVNHLTPIGCDRPSLRVIEKRWWGCQLFGGTRIGRDPPQRQLPIGKETLCDQSTAVRVPVRTYDAEIIAGKLQHFHSLAVDVQHPDLVVP